MTKERLDDQGHDLLKVIYILIRKCYVWILKIVFQPQQHLLISICKILIDLLIYNRIKSDIT